MSTAGVLEGMPSMYASARGVLCVCLNPAFELAYEMDSIAEEVNTALASSFVPSGKATNVARIVSRFSESCELLLPSPSNDLGEYYLRTLREAHPSLTVRLLEHLVVDYRISTVVSHRSDRQRTTILRMAGGGGPAGADRAGEVLDEIEQRIPRDGLVVLSGSAPPNLPADFYGSVVERARTRSASALVDVSGEQLQEALKTRPFLVKINLDEASRTLGASPGAGSPDLLSEALRAAGAANAIVTDGGRPYAVALSDGTSRARTPLPRQPLSPTGTGDAFLAGIAASLAAGSTPGGAALLEAVSVGERLAGEASQFLQSGEVGHGD